MAMVHLYHSRGKAVNFFETTDIFGYSIPRSIAAHLECHRIAELTLKRLAQADLGNNAGRLMSLERVG
jgi:hypothetical protein